MSKGISELKSQRVFNHFGQRLFFSAILKVGRDFTGSSQDKPRINFRLPLFVWDVKHWANLRLRWWPKPRAPPEIPTSPPEFGAQSEKSGDNHHGKVTASDSKGEWSHSQLLVQWHHSLCFNIFLTLLHQLPQLSAFFRIPSILPRAPPAVTSWLNWKILYWDVWEVLKVSNYWTVNAVCDACLQIDFTRPLNCSHTQNFTIFFFYLKSYNQIW